MNIDYKTQVRQIILDSQAYDKFLGKLSGDIMENCKKANSESTIASRIELNLNKALEWHGENYEPIREQSVNSLIGKVKSGRVDSRFRNIITEYKKNLTEDNLEESSTQLSWYIENLSEKEKQIRDKYIGILTDGKLIRFINYKNNLIECTELLPFDKNNLKEVVKIYLSIERKNLSSQNLLDDFFIGNKNSLTKQLAIALYNSLENPSEKTYMLHSEWERLFQLATHNDNNQKAIKYRNIALASCFNMSVQSFDQIKGLFALQTTYTIIIKLVAYNTLSRILFEKSNLKFSEQSKLDSNSLQNLLENIENGEIFQNFGISNLLEAGFFSWYVFEGAWTDQIYLAIRDCIKVLSEYDGNQVIFNKNNFHDLFNDLYESILPQEVRHSLGEYYTPAWLADSVVRNAVPKINTNSEWRGLDPCAGSGTFVLKMIEAVLEEKKDDILLQILNRVKAIDINPLAVQTCRINYFVAISNIIDFTKQENIEIPVYLGDSANVPLVTSIDNVKVMNYKIETRRGDIELSLPLSIFASDNNLSTKITSLENAIIQLNSKRAFQIILESIPEKERTKNIRREVSLFVDNLIYLEQQHWDRIWVRVIVNYLRTATLGKFDVIVGNPPWIDWKSLPDGYRQTIKKIAIERHLFSGDTFTGGINLNICALIANVSANNWLIENGVFAFLMPKSLAFQQSYSGFRELIQNDGINLKYILFHDWSLSGNPFYPVTEKFMTYFFKKTKNIDQEIVPTQIFKIKKGYSVKNIRQESFDNVVNYFDIIDSFAFKNCSTYNNFTFEKDKKLIPLLKKFAGASLYKGRVGLGLYPKEILLFKIIKNVGAKALVENYQGKTTERKNSTQTLWVESNYLFPVLEGPDIHSFGVDNYKFVAPFPYTKNNIKRPIEPEVLENNSPLLYKYYLGKKNLLQKTEYNQRVQGNKGEFYSLTRVGDYTFAKHRVVYRNNTKWVAAVVSTVNTKWGGEKNYLLLDHACSISQDNSGRFISENEAHYICALMNCSLAKEYILNSSDARSFKTDLVLNIEKYNENSFIHNALTKISILAHDKEIDSKNLDAVLDYFSILYIDKISGVNTQLVKAIDERNILILEKKYWYKNFINVDR